MYVEDLVKLSNTLISLTGPRVSICPLVSIPLSRVSDSSSVADTANMDSWVVSNKMAPNISLPGSRNKLWDVLCRSTSTLVETGPKGKVLFLPLSLTNPCKHRFNAGVLQGPLPVTIHPLDQDMECKVVCALTRELNDCYCLSLPTDPILDHCWDAPAHDLSGTRLVFVGSSHAGKLSALVLASLETTFLKLPHQSQMLEAAKDLADKLGQLGLTKDDVIYLDLISNLVFLGTDQDGNSIEPFKGEGRKWHISGSLVAADKPRIRRLLDKMAASVGRPGSSV